MNYNNEELVAVSYAIGESGGNCLLASRIYAQNRYFRDRVMQIVKEALEIKL